MEQEARVVRVHGADGAPCVEPGVADDAGRPEAPGVDLRATKLRRRRRALCQFAAEITTEPPNWSASTVLWWARRQAGFTQEELATRIGMNPRTVAHWEEERKPIPSQGWISALEACGYRIILDRIE